jgi:putative membrane protein
MIAKLIAGIFANGIGLYLVGHYVSGATIPFTIQGLVLAALVLTLINFIIAPILKLLLSPLIFITFGLAGLLVNGTTLYILTRILPTVSFGGLVSLAYATIILTLVNLAVHLI